VVKVADATKVADSVVRVFIDHGDRTNRNKARLKYVLDAWGFDKFLAAMEENLGEKLARLPPEAIAPRPEFNRLAMWACIRRNNRGYSGSVSCCRSENSQHRKCADSPASREIWAMAIFV